MVDDADFNLPCDDVKISSLARVAARVVKHQSVLDQAMRYGPVLPLHCGKLFESMEGVHEYLASHEDTICAYFDEIKDKHEWTVQGYLDSKLCEIAILEREQVKADNRGRLSPISRALRAALTKMDIKYAVDDWVEGKCTELFASLKPLSANSCEGRLLLRDGVSDSCEMITNWSFLVDNNHMEDFRALVERNSDDCFSEGLSFHLSGPWPSYSFCPCIEEE